MLVNEVNQALYFLFGRIIIKEMQKVIIFFIFLQVAYQVLGIKY